MVGIHADRQLRKLQKIDPTLYLDAMKTLSSNAALTANAGGKGLDVETLPVKGRRMSLDVPFHRTNYLRRKLLLTAETAAPIPNSSNEPGSGTPCGEAVKVRLSMNVLLGNAPPEE